MTAVTTGGEGGCPPCACVRLPPAPSPRKRNTSVGFGGEPVASLLLVVMPGAPFVASLFLVGIWWGSMPKSPMLPTCLKKTGDLDHLNHGRFRAKMRRRTELSMMVCDVLGRTVLGQTVWVEPSSNRLGAPDHTHCLGAWELGDSPRSFQYTFSEWGFSCWEIHEMEKNKGCIETLGGTSSWSLQQPALASTPFHSFSPPGREERQRVQVNDSGEK